MRQPARCASRPVVAGRLLRVSTAIVLVAALCLPATALAAPAENGEAAATERDAADRQMQRAREEAAASTPSVVAIVSDETEDETEMVEKNADEGSATKQPDIAKGPVRIHILSFYDAGEATIIETGGHFGLIDTGEDDRYPDGSDPRYPIRPGTTIGHGVTDKLLAYMDKLGITEDNFDFFIGTHPHSDHIGGADIIIRKYKPAFVYTPEYKDEYIIGAAANWANHGALWDNLFVYDNLLTACRETEGVTLVQSFSEEEGTQPAFEFGAAAIEFFNYDEDYKVTPVGDANNFSWGVKITAFDKTAFISGDINNFDGDESRLSGKLGRIDVLKLGHHGLDGSNTPAYLQTILKPSPSRSPIAIQTGSYRGAPAYLLDALDAVNAHYYTTEEAAQDSKAAIVVTFDEEGLTTNVSGSPQTLRERPSSPHLTNYVDGKRAPLSGWISYDNRWYWFDNDATAAEAQWRAIGGSWYWLAENGAMATGWAHDGTAWYFMEPSGIMRSGGWLLDHGTWYYLSASGAMQTGWLNLAGTWYWLGDDGRMRTDWYQVGGTWYYANVSGAMQANGWLNVSGTWYWLEPSGAMAENSWKLVNGTWYWLAPGGAMATGWYRVGGAWYLSNTSGAMLTGWQRVGNAWYYLRSSGAMAEGWIKLGSAWYYLKPGSGAMHTGWLQLNGAWYYLNGSGAMVTGRQFIDGHAYVFSPSGALVG